MKPQQNEIKATANAGSEDWLETVRRQVGSLRFGVVQIVVHESRIVQIEKTERIRFGTAGVESISPTKQLEA
ncbi:MAG: YezD family protein [Verrucomicrobia bacterium]|nr:YezD family protein [Verrucomicrobiota bacterium]